MGKFEVCTGEIALYGAESAGTIVLSIFIGLKNGRFPDGESLVGICG